MKIKFSLLITFSFLLCALLSNAQTDEGKTYQVSGTITDELTGEALIGANVTYETGKGVQTDVNGAFTLLLPNGKYDIKISYVGYNTVSRKIAVEGKDRTFDGITLTSANNLEEVEIAADVARTRETPIAFSDIDAQQIAEEMGSNDMTMLLNTTPGAYASQQGGGAGDSRVNIRGFDQRNIAVLVDGVPVNDMETGQVFWSNWSGLSEITKKLQVQRGLGASRLAVPSVGGVMNFITTPVDQKQFFTIKENMGTADYQRYSAAYNSGMIKNKIGFVMAGSYTSGGAYIDQTWQKTWSYFGKVTYKINEKNLIILGFNGSPQTHGQRSFAINPAYHDTKFAQNLGINTDSIYANPKQSYTTKDVGARGITYSPDWGYVNGKPVNAKMNYFNKPMVNLSYFLTINQRLSFSNVLYYSNGTGGGTTSTDFSYDKTTGQLNFQNDYNANSAPSNVGKVVPGQKQSNNYIYSSINDHDWVGTLTTFKYKQSSRLDFLGGLDARYYVGTHYQTPYDLLGGDFVLSTSNLNVNPILANTVKHVGDKINYYYQSKITWLGVFGQAEYKSKNVTAFLTVTGNQSTLQETNYFARKDIVFSDNDIARAAVGYGDTLYRDNQTNKSGVAIPGTKVVHANDGSITFYDNMTKRPVTIGSDRSVFNSSSSNARTNLTPFKVYYGYTVKGGANYKLDRNHNVYVNLGNMSFTPRFTNVFDRSGLALQGVKNQQIITGEIGYTLKYSNFSLTLNGYLTKWGNRPLDFGAQSKKVDPQTQLPIYYNINGVDAILKGFEFDANYKFNKIIEARFYGTVADWRWNSGGTAYAYTEAGTPIDTTKFDAKGVHIGNAPQLQLGTNVRVMLFKGFYIKPQLTHFARMYAQFDPTALKVDNTAHADYRGMDTWKMPGYTIFDLYLGYRITSYKVKVDITMVMNNVLNTVYMTDASFPSGVTPVNYNATNAVGWMGLGRRINIGVKLTF